jgi:glucokinase
MSPRQCYHIAVDVGGTQLRAARYSSEGLIPVRISRISTRHPHATPLERLDKLIGSLWPEDGQVEAIAVATPGPTDPHTGTVVEAPNIPGWINLPLRRHLEEQFHVPVAIGNDANLAALGEYRYGAGQGHRHVIYVTISTGIGGGIIMEDRLLLGVRGLAAEIGHVTVLPDGPLCGCGHRGHLEAVASGTAIASWVEMMLAQGAESSLPVDEKLSAKHIAQAAREGDPLAVAALERAGNFIGQALAEFLHIFNPSIVIIGGGVSQSGDLLLDPIRAAMPKSVMAPAYLENLTVTTAALGDDAGLLGALALARSLSNG